VDFVGNPVACNMKFIFINMDTCDLADSRVPREMKLFYFNIVEKVVTEYVLFSCYYV